MLNKKEVTLKIVSFVKSSPTIKRKPNKSSSKSFLQNGISRILKSSMSSSYAPKELIVETIQTMLDNHHEGSYIYVEHNLVFFEPIELKDVFGVLAQKIHEAKPEN